MDYLFLSWYFDHEDIVILAGSIVCCSDNINTLRTDGDFCHRRRNTDIAQKI
jgi:hypothetical protein